MGGIMRICEYFSEYVSIPEDTDRTIALTDKVDIDSVLFRQGLPLKGASKHKIIDTLTVSHAPTGCSHFSCVVNPIRIFISFLGVYKSEIGVLQLFVN